MIRLSKLKTYAKQIRTNARTGNTELEALDMRRQNPLQEIRIPVNGYILKPNEIYVVEVDNPGSTHFCEEDFTKELIQLGVSCKVMDDECLLTVQRPVRIYPGVEMFYEENGSK